VPVNRHGPPFAFIRTWRVEGTSAASPLRSPRRSDSQTSTGSDPSVRDQYDNLADTDLRCLLTDRASGGGVQAWVSDLADQAMRDIGNTVERAILKRDYTAGNGVTP